MSEKIKILMLGDSISGKTCFMLGIYAAIQDGMRFNLKATDLEEGLRLTNLWSTIVNNYGGDRWPPTGDQLQTYNFKLCYGYKPLIEFEWLDYRGGCMSNPSSPDEIETLRGYANESNGLFFCISGEYLRNPVTEANLQKITIESKANLMGDYLQDLNINREPARKKTFPIVIIVTKYDYCYHRNKRELIEDIKKIFSPLFASGSGWLVTICPVTLGKELAQDRDNGKIEPKNFDLPLPFVSYCILTEQARSQYEKRKEIEYQLDVLKSSNPLIKLIQWQDRVKKIRDINQRLEQANMQLKETKDMIKILAKELDLSITDIYLSGKKIKIDLKEKN